MSGMHMNPFQPHPQHNDTSSYQHAPALQTMSAPRRKLGRPRKFVEPSVAMPLAIIPAPPLVNATQRPKKRKVQGESSTATKKQQAVTAAGSSVDIGNITPEVITIQVGQDVATKIMSLSGNGWAVCILSAQGAVSNVTLRQGASSGETVNYEGYFEMLSLCGSYVPSETDGISSCTGGLSVSFASLDGRLFGGAVAGPLTAASPVQVVVGRFPVDEEKKLKQAATSGIPAASSSTPRGSLNGSSGRPGSAPN